MTKELRQFPREEIKIEVELRLYEHAVQTAITRNVSQGGLFILLKDIEHFTLGEMVHLQYKNPLANSEETEKDAIIVRHAENGIAVAFVEMDEF